MYNDITIRYENTKFSCIDTASNKVLLTNEKNSHITSIFIYIDDIQGIVLTFKPDGSYDRFNYNGCKNIVGLSVRNVKNDEIRIRHKELKFQVRYFSKREFSSNEITRYEKLQEKIDMENPIKELPPLIIDLPPEPFSRPRYSRNLKGFYNPREGYKNKCETLVKEYLPEDFELIEGEIYINFEFYIPINKNIYNTKSRFYLAMAKFFRPLVKPDLDNYLKPLMDVLSDNIYVDDNQIVELSAKKFFAIEPIMSHTKIFIKYRKNKMKFN